MQRARPTTHPCSLWQKIFATKFNKTHNIFFLPLHALTCRHPCQRGGARGSHARVDLGDLLTARMSGAGCAGRSIIQQPPLSLRPSPLPEQSCSRSRRGRTCRLSLLGRACSISWRALSGVMSHISAQDRPVRGSMSRRLGMKLGLGLRMRRRCGDGGGGAAVGCRRLPSATRPAAERPAERWACPRSRHCESSSPPCQPEMRRGYPPVQLTEEEVFQICGRLCLSVFDRGTDFCIFGRVQGFFYPCPEFPTFSAFK